MVKLLPLILIISGCQKAEDKFEPHEPDDAVKAEYTQLSESIRDNFTIGGFGVISRKPNGEPEHQGEALIWGGTYLWAAPCTTAEPVSRAMAGMVDRLDGQLIRVDPLGEYIGGREVTLDGAIGFMLGVSRRLSDCGEWQLWEQPLRKMVAFQEANGDRLHRQVQAKIVGEWKYLRDLLSHKAGNRSEPDPDRLRDLEKTIGGWALAVKLAHETRQGSDACFRINLGLSSLLTAETLGRAISQDGRNQFCQNTKGMDIPTVDHYCGRKNIKEYLETYQPHVYEYRHQRCHWESPDGKNNTSPQLDKLIAYTIAYGFTPLQN